MEKSVRIGRESKIYLLVGTACGLIILFSMLVVAAPNSAHLLPDEWTVSFEDNTIGSLTPPIYFSGDNKDFFQGIYSFEYTLALDPEALDELTKPVIVFPGISGNGLRVSVNGNTIGMKGDLLSGKASIWNFAYAFFIPGHLLGEKNTVRIELYSLYEVGLNRIPYITDSGRPMKFKLFLILWSVNFMLFVIGGMVILGIVFFVTGILGETRDLKKIYLGLALFFISFFFLDYSFLDNTVLSYIAFKKIVISSHFCGLLFFILYLSELASLREKRFTILLSIFMLFFAFVTLIHPGNMVQFRKFYRLAYLSNLILFIFLIYLFIRKVKHSTEFITIFSGGFTALIFALHDAICLFVDGGQIFLSHYGIVVLFLCGASVMIYQIINIYIESVLQSYRAEQFYAEAMRDSLTGVYNRKILPALENGLNSEFSVLLFDLDDFKLINDTYGHGAGDLALKAFTKLINSIIRSNDYVIRIGGDEFIAVLPGCAINTADDQGFRICNAVESLELVYKDKTFSISTTLGTAYGKRGASLAGVIEEADIRMYKNKQS